MRARTPADIAFQETLDPTLKAFRRALHRAPRFAAALRAGRAAVHFGPWRRSAQQLIRRLRSEAAAIDGASAAFPGLDVEAAASALHRQSAYVAGVIGTPGCQRLVDLASRLETGHFELVHEACEDVRSIVDDAGVQRLLRKYFGCPGVLLESTLVVTAPNRPLSSQNYFHFDFAGWQSLNLFVYLSDVSVDTGPHEVALGSHRTIGIRDVLNPQVSDDRAKTRFGSSIQTITGPAGTAFFENTEAFHRRRPDGGRRAMLNLLFASHRGFFSRGRTSRDHRRRRDRTLQALERAATARG